MKAEKKKKIISLVSIAIIAVVGTVLLVLSKAATFPTTAVYSVTPASGSYNINSTFSVNIYEDSGSTPVLGVSFDLLYDQTKLQLIPPSSSAPTVPVDMAGSAFPTCPEKIGSTGKVTMYCITDRLGTLGTAVDSVTGKQLIGKLTFKVLAGSGTTALTFSPTTGTPAQPTSIFEVTTGTNVWNGATAGATFTLTTPDTTPPVVTNGSPTNGATVSGTTSVTATVTDDRGTLSSVMLAIGNATPVSMTAGAAGAFSYNGNTPAVADGNYNLVITAKDAAGNTTVGTTRTVTVLNAKPDLTVTGVTLSPANPDVGDVVTITATIKNNGSLTTPSGIDAATTISVDGTAISTQSNTTALAAGASRTVTTTWTATSGTHPILAATDTGNKVAESNESNNSASISKTVYKKGDVNNDNFVNGDDLMQVLLNWKKTTGMTRTTGDVTGDGQVNGDDLIQVLTNWKK